MEKSVVIIGAGPAGLAAAHELLTRGRKNVLVLEATNSIGGISRTVSAHGNLMDIGGHRFHTKYERVNRWWLGIMPLADATKTDRAMLRRDRLSSIYYGRKLYSYPIKPDMSMFKNLGVITVIKVGFSYVRATLFKRNERTLEDFFVNRFGFVLYQMFFEKYTEKVWGKHPRDLPADWGAQRVKGVSIFSIIKNILGIGKKETSLIDDFFYPKLGSGSLFEHAAKDIEAMGGSVIMGACVVGVETDGGRVVGVSYTKDGALHRVEAEAVLSSMPLAELVVAMKAPSPVLRVASGLPYRAVIVVSILASHTSLKENWIYTQEPSIQMGRIQIWGNWSPYLVLDPGATSWIGCEYFCDHGDDFWRLTDEEISELASSELTRMGIISGERMAYHVEREAKAYPSYTGLYAEIGQLVDYVNSFENLVCIGRNGQHRYNNMDHCVMTGLMGADFILGTLIDKNKIWEVNTASEYQEKAV